MIQNLRSKGITKVDVILKLRAKVSPLITHFDKHLFKHLSPQSLKKCRFIDIMADHKKDNKEKKESKESTKDSKNEKNEKTDLGLGLLEEDDEFEEFPAEGLTNDSNPCIALQPID